MQALRVESGLDAAKGIWQGVVGNTAYKKLWDRTEPAELRAIRLRSNQELS